MRLGSTILWGPLLCAALACGSSTHPKKTTPANVEKAPVLDGMGDHTYEITTSSEEAQRFFDQGLVLAWAFNHVEAFRSFRYAASLDPKCGMCFWGAAFVLGPNINRPMDPSDNEAAWTAAQQALKLAPSLPEKEQALIQAMSARYSETAPEDRGPLEQAFADAMASVHEKYADDTVVAQLYAEALMDLHPWDYWKSDGEPQEWTAKILGLLEATLKTSPDAPGANHFLIHATEASKTPARALAAAERLETLVPGAGHLVHMPSHIFLRTGDYARASESNRQAIKSDQAYITQCRSQEIYPLVYHPHNWHFLSRTAALEGNKAEAIKAALHVQGHVPDDKMREEGWGTLQHYWVTPFNVMVRFGMWEEILALQQPAKDLEYLQVAWRFSRGMAFAATNKEAEAKAELEKLKVLATNEVLKKVTIWEINSAFALGKVAVQVLEGEIHTRLGDAANGIPFLVKAVALQDELNYNEPPDWFYSVRLSLGVAFLKAGKAEEAERVYQEDLQVFPENGWALKGLELSLRAQGKAEEANDAGKRHLAAWKNADTPIEESRF